VALEKISAGDPQQPNKPRKTVALHEKLKRVVEDYNNRSTGNFLKQLFAIYSLIDVN